MNGIIVIGPYEVDSLAKEVVDVYRSWARYEEVRTVYGIPRGGLPVAYRIAWELNKAFGWQPTVDAVHEGRHDPNGIIVDDIVDTGATILRYKDCGMPIMSLLVRDATRLPAPDIWGKSLHGSMDWVQFPWDEPGGGGPKDSVVRILEYLGYDPRDPALLETPRRFLSWLDEFRAEQPAPETTTFSGITYDQMVVVKDIPFISLCEHHLLPFTGKAHVAYIPIESKVIGLSKIARIVNWHARRLQVQERLTQEIMHSVSYETGCEHVGVVVSAEHSCMSVRGPKAQGSMTVTSALKGDFKTDSKTREEFLKLASV